MGKAENKVEDKLCKGVKALGGRAYKLISPGANGMPDRLICLPNERTIFVETKAPNGRLRPQQKHRINELRRMKQTVLVLYSVSEVNKFLKEIEKELMRDEIHAT